MEYQQIQDIITKQKNFFATDITRNLVYRKNALKKLYTAIKDNEQLILEALSMDLGKSQTEAYMCEVGLVLGEISYMLKNLRKLAKEQSVLTPLAHFHSHSYKKPVPYGCVLVMSPWNYPFMLTLEPVVDAIAAGNTVVIKPSAYSSATSNIIAKLIGECFNEEYVAVILGGRAENTHLLSMDFDYIFFTGSTNVGMEVMSNAAKKLIPITLELGGKSPCIVDETANIELAAKRIVFGKYLNCGQTCVAPDYILCHQAIADSFKEAVKREIIKQYGTSPLTNPSYGKIINTKHFNRIMGLIDKDKVIIGGQGDGNTLKIEPTVMDKVTFEDKVMQEEIFGPIMPIITFNDLKDIANYISKLPHPLAFYIFSSNKMNINYLQNHCNFGGGCINDTIIHLATSNMGFGGVGHSGMGAYHGKAGFDTFTHYKSIVDKKTWLDLPMRYQPYNKIGEFLIRLFLK